MEVFTLELLELVADEAAEEKLLDEATDDLAELLLDEATETELPLDALEVGALEEAAEEEALEDDTCDGDDTDDFELTAGVLETLVAEDATELMVEELDDSLTFSSTGATAVFTKIDLTGDQLPEVSPTLIPNK